MSDLTAKLITWYFTNKQTIDALKDDQYVLELEERVKDIIKVGRYVWDNPEVQKLLKSLKSEFPLSDKPLFTADTKGPNPLNAKGDIR
jgi:D-alanyl-D-alanine carboxypeptidase